MPSRRCSPDKPVPVETTKVFGCSTKWADKQSTAVESLKKWDAEPVTLETIDLAGVQKLAKNAAAATTLRKPIQENCCW